MSIAEAVHTEIERYRASAWQFERGRVAPADPRRAILHRVLTLTGGATPSVRTLRRMFAPVAKKTRLDGHRSEVDLPR